MEFECDGEMRPAGVIVHRLEAPQAFQEIERAVKQADFHHFCRHEAIHGLERMAHAGKVGHQFRGQLPFPTRQDSGIGHPRQE